MENQKQQFFDQQKLFVQGGVKKHIRISLDSQDVFVEDIEDHTSYIMQIGRLRDVWSPYSTSEKMREVMLLLSNCEELIFDYDTKNFLVKDKGTESLDALIQKDIDVFIEEISNESQVTS